MADSTARLPDPPGQPTPWYRRWYAIVAYIFLGLIFLGALVGEGDEPEDEDEDERSPSPEPELVEVPDVVGMSFDDARAALRSVDLGARRRTTDSDGQDPDTVVRTMPAAGAEVDEGRDVVVVVAREPAPPPTTTEPPPPTTTQPPPTTTQPPATQPPPPPTTQPPPPPEPDPVYYSNCSEARAAGAAPVRRGDPGYGTHLDRDGDGIGCE